MNSVLDEKTSPTALSANMASKHYTACRAFQLLFHLCILLLSLHPMAHAQYIQDYQWLNHNGVAWRRLSQLLPSLTNANRIGPSTLAKGKDTESKARCNPKERSRLVL